MNINDAESVILKKQTIRFALSEKK